MRTSRIPRLKSSPQPRKYRSSVQFAGLILVQAVGLRGARQPPNLEASEVVSSAVWLSSTMLQKKQQRQRHAPRRRGGAGATSDAHLQPSRLNSPGCMRASYTCTQSSLPW